MVFAVIFKWNFLFRLKVEFLGDLSCIPLWFVWFRNLSFGYVDCKYVNKFY